MHHKLFFCQVNWRALCVVTTCTLLVSTLATAQAPVPVVATEASSRQADYLGPQNLVATGDLVPDPQLPGALRLPTSTLPYNSAYGQPNDEAPLVHFDFGALRTIDRFHVWNTNDPAYVWRGFRSVTIQFSDDAARWTSVPERFVFERAPGTDAYTGQRVVLPRAITARFIRFVCNSTWREGGNPDIASLGRVMFFAGGTPQPPPQESGRWPLASGVVNVKEAPYFARGDGVSDDTAALQRAILDHEGTRRTLYLPEGTYLVTAPLKFTENASYNRNGRFGQTTLRGDNTADTVVRLKDRTLIDASAPKAVLSTGFISFWNGSFEETTADWFNVNVSDLTIDIGRGNPGAKGLEFYSNNTGSVRNVRIVSRDRQGAIGLDLGHLDKNGPLLVKGLVVDGFAIGVRTAQTVNSQTFENILLRRQTETAFDNNGQAVSIRRLATLGEVTALRNRFGFATVVDSALLGVGRASALPAVVNGEFLFARNVGTSGFARAVDNQFGAVGSVAGPLLSEYSSSGETLRLFPGTAGSLRLPVRDIEPREDVPSGEWVNARDFRLTSEDNDAPALQRAIDSGARTVFVPTDAHVVLKSDVLVRGGVTHLHGMQASVIATAGATIRVVDSADASSLVVAEQFRVVSLSDQPVFENASSRRFALLDSEAGVRGIGSGAVFLENVAGRFDFGAHETWARQLNTEPEGLKISNRGGRLWVLGIKTERAGTVVATQAGGATEILGGLIYTTTASTDPMFSVTDARLSASVAEVAYGIPPYAELVRETRAGVTRSLARGQAPLRFSFLGGSALPLFVGAP